LNISLQGLQVRVFGKTGRGPPCGAWFGKMNFGGFEISKRYCMNDKGMIFGMRKRLFILR
jgi:hypothetical protein